MRRRCHAHNASGSSTCSTPSPSTSGPARSRTGRAPAPATARRLAAQAERFEAARARRRRNSALWRSAVNLAPSNADAWRSLGRLLGAHGGALEARSRRRGAAPRAHARAGLVGSARAARPARAPARRRQRVAPARSARRPRSTRARSVSGGRGVDRRRRSRGHGPRSPGAGARRFARLRRGRGVAYALGGAVPQATVDGAVDDGAGAVGARSTGVRKLARGDRAAKKKPRAAPTATRWRPLDRSRRRARRPGGAVRRGPPAPRPATGRARWRISSPTSRASPAGASGRSARAARRARGAGPSERRPRRRAPRPSPAGAHSAARGSTRRRAARARRRPARRELPANRLVALGLVHEYADRRAPRPASATRWPLPRPMTAPRWHGCRASTRACPTSELAGRPPAARARRPASTSPPPVGAGAAGAPRRARRGRRAARTPLDAPWPWQRRRPRQPTAGSPAAETRARAGRRVARRRGDPAPHGGARSLPAWPWRWRARRLPVRRRSAGGRSSRPLRRPGALPRGGRRRGRAATRRPQAPRRRHRRSRGPPGRDREELARALTEATSDLPVVAALTTALVQAARGAGRAAAAPGARAGLGRATRDLLRAEPAGHPRAARRSEELRAIDRRLRGQHADALTPCCRRARAPASTPRRCPLDRRRRGRKRAEGGRRIAPALLLARSRLDFPVELDALSADLQQPPAQRPGRRRRCARARPSSSARDRERDVTGTSMCTLLVGDSAPAALTLEAIEVRESGRGLAIVRDLVRAWRGHLVCAPRRLRSSKLVGACFRCEHAG